MQTLRGLATLRLASFSVSQCFFHEVFEEINISGGNSDEDRKAESGRWRSPPVKNDFLRLSSEAHIDTKFSCIMQDILTGEQMQNLIRQPSDTMSVSPPFLPFSVKW